MVYVLKEPVDNSKGIIVFREKYILETDDDLLKRQLERLKERYLLTYYWAHYTKTPDPIPFVDAHFASPGTVKEFKSDDVYRIPFNSRNFTPDYFRNHKIEPRWDLLCIAVPLKFKKIPDLFEVLQLVWQEKADFNVLLWCPTPQNINERPWDERVFEIYENDLSQEQRNKMDFCTPPRIGEHTRPVPKIVMPYLYNSGKIFTLFTEKEGGSKAISEALLCGTPVVVRSGLKGGGRDYLDNQNSRQFSTKEEAKDIFIEMNENIEDYYFDPTYLRDELVESYAAEKLEFKFMEIFNEEGIPYKGEIEKKELYNKLCMHTPTIPREFRNHPGRGILKSKSAAYKYFDHLLVDLAEDAFGD